MEKNEERKCSKHNKLRHLKCINEEDNIEQNKASNKRRGSKAQNIEDKKEEEDDDDYLVISVIDPNEVLKDHDTLLFISEEKAEPKDSTEKEERNEITISTEVKDVVSMVEESKVEESDEIPNVTIAKEDTKRDKDSVPQKITDTKGETEFKKENELEDFIPIKLESKMVDHVSNESLPEIVEADKSTEEINDVKYVIDKVDTEEGSDFENITVTENVIEEDVIVKPEVRPTVAETKDEKPKSEPKKSKDKEVVTEVCIQSKFNDYFNTPDVTFPIETNKADPKKKEETIIEKEGPNVDNDVITPYQVHPEPPQNVMHIPKENEITKDPERQPITRIEKERELKGGTYIHYRTPPSENKTNDNDIGTKKKIEKRRTAETEKDFETPSVVEYLNKDVEDKDGMSTLDKEMEPGTTIHHLTPETPEHHIINDDPGAAELMGKRRKAEIERYIVNSFRTKDKEREQDENAAQMHLPTMDVKMKEDTFKTFMDSKQQEMMDFNTGHFKKLQQSVEDIKTSNQTLVHELKESITRVGESIRGTLTETEALQKSLLKNEKSKPEEEEETEYTTTEQFIPRANRAQQTGGVYKGATGFVPFENKGFKRRQNGGFYIRDSRDFYFLHK